MKKIYSLIIIICFSLLVPSSLFSQSLVALGNTNFPINDNTSTAPVAAINGGWQINGIGKVVKIVPHPSIATTLYACSASGGIFITTNSGNSWLPVGGSFMPGVQFGCLAIDPVNPLIFYAGTGEPTYAQNYSWGGYGVFKSADGGITWMQINNTMGNTVVADIIINPANSQELVACTTNGIYKSINSGNTWVTTLVATGQWIRQIRRQGSGSNLVAAGNSRFYRSTDFGNTWTTSDLDPAFSSIFINGRVAVAPSNPQVVYAGWVNKSSANSNNACIFYSTDGGISFTKKFAFANSPKLLSYDGTGPDGYGWANFFITVSAADPNTLFTGGHIIFKSTDNGANWLPTLTQWYCCIHTDIHQLMYDPNNSSRFLAATDGGVFVSSSEAQSWLPLSNGLACNQYMSMGQSNIDPNFVIGGLQDNGIIYNNTDGNYHTYCGGDLYDHMTCDYTNNYNVYTSNSGGKVFNTYNRTQSADLNLPFSLTPASRQSFFISALDPAISYWWDSDVWVSRNINSYNLSTGTSSVAWTQISNFGVNILDVKTSPGSDSVVYALTTDAKIYKSVNALSPAPVFTPLPLPQSASSGIAGSLTISALNPNVLYATANNAVYRSANAGSSWSNYTGTGLPDINFQKIVIDPYSSIESVYLITAIGVYYRDLTQNGWTAINPPISAPPQNSAASFAGIINGASLFKGTGSSTSHISFATWGSGIWKTGFYNQQNGALPAGFNNADIGAPAIAGSGFYDNTKHNYNLSGAGSGINAAGTDQFNFTSAALSGNSDLVVKIYSVAETDTINGLSKTGLMLRSSVNANAPYVLIALTGHAGAVFQFRANSGEVATINTVSPAPTEAFPYWLRLNKTAGNLISAFISADGINWLPAGQTTVDMGTGFLGGIATTSNNWSRTNKTSASDIALNGFIITTLQNIQLHAVAGDQNKVGLSWSFDSDEPSNIAMVESSTDGRNFNGLFTKNYSNTTGTVKTFADAGVDASPFEGDNYYRLKIVMKNGNTKYSGIEHIYISKGISITLKPNPVKRNEELKLLVAGGIFSGNIDFELYDIAGRKMQSQKLLNAGINTLHPVNLAAGTYLYRIACKGKVLTGKLVVN
jgi:hypothetical protein